VETKQVWLTFFKKPKYFRKILFVVVVLPRPSGVVTFSGISAVVTFSGLSVVVTFSGISAVETLSGFSVVVLLSPGWSIFTHSPFCFT
jgi:hypothetical protein